jgi:cobalt-zinc-cadmium efflux system membrane fusion protein
VYDATKVAHVRARAPGTVKTLKVDIGAQVKKGDTLAVVESGQVGADRSKIGGASARVKAAEEELKRKKDLQAEGITTRSEVVGAEKELAEARSEVDALSATLAVVGKAAPGVGGYLVEAPIGGVVTALEPTIGEVVELNGLLFEIVDTSRVWVELDVPESDLAKVRIGQQVAVTLEALAGRELLGTIEYLAPSVDPQTRTAKARLSLANPDGTLRANLFGRARILDDKGKNHVVVPRAAVQRAREQRVVFVKLAKDLYETRHVKIGASVGEDKLEIIEGIVAGEAVVTTGSFLLKTETLKESIGAGCCEVD